MKTRTAFIGIILCVVCFPVNGQTNKQRAKLLKEIENDLRDTSNKFNLREKQLPVCSLVFDQLRIPRSTFQCH